VDAPAAELFVVVDSPFLGVRFAGAGQKGVDVGLDLFEFAGGVDPGAVQYAVVLVGEAGDIDGR
jgi:hypothetical protein